MIQHNCLATCALRWMSQNHTNQNSILVQVMASCHKAPSQYLSQCWSVSVLPYECPSFHNVLKTSLSHPFYWRKLIYFGLQKFLSTFPVHSKSASVQPVAQPWIVDRPSGLILGLHPANEQKSLLCNISHWLGASLESALSLCLNQMMTQDWCSQWWLNSQYDQGLILGLHPANEKWRYKVTLSLAGSKPRISPVMKS